LKNNQNRILQLDIIRGFALLGIFLVNMPSFHSPQFMYSFFGLSQSYTEFEKGLAIFQKLFIEMKFYPIFSFLFGLSFYLFLSKYPVFSFIKRMIVLLLIGLCHLLFLWYGDILHAYALTGIMLIPFYRLKPKQILIWSIIFLFTYHLILLSTIFSSIKYVYDERFINENIKAYVTLYQSDSYFHWFFSHLQIEVIPILFQFPLSIFPILGFFLLGLYAGKKNLFSISLKNKRLIKKLIVWCSFISLLLVITNFIFLTYDIFTSPIQHSISQFVTSLSGVSLSILYMCTIYLWVTKEKWKKALLPFQYVGRMSLTNYLFQSLISIGIIRIFDLYGKLNLIEGTLLCVLIFAMQTIVSYIWLLKFKKGPIEWFWRKVTKT